MSDFAIYLHQGIKHILDLEGLDHMVFIITMCAVFDTSEWKKILILITAFTIGHSITLALAALDILRINPTLIETLIPVTILLTSIYNVGFKHTKNQKVGINYLLPLFFGLIHGLGFSNFFRAMMMGISDQSIVLPLFSFNVGIEIGQIMIASGIFLIFFLFKKLLGIQHKNWNLYVSGSGGGIAITMIVKALI